LWSGSRYRPWVQTPIPHTKKQFLSWVWRCTPIIPSFGRLRQDDDEFQARLGHRVRPCLKKWKNVVLAPSAQYQCGKWPPLWWAHYGKVHSHWSFYCSALLWNHLSWILFPEFEGLTVHAPMSISCKALSLPSYLGLHVVMTGTWNGAATLQNWQLLKKLTTDVPYNPENWRDGDVAQW
jgi:hypothetical protein